MIVERLTLPTAEPVTPDQARLSLRVDGNDEIDVISEMVTSARQSLEDYLQRSICSQTWRVTLAAFPADRWIALPMPPVLSISSIKYMDNNSAQQTLASDAYSLIGDEEGARAVLKDGQSWPPALCGSASVTVEFVAGYTQVPERFRSHILALLSIWFDDRTKRGQIPGGFASQDRIFA